MTEERIMTAETITRLVESLEGLPIEWGYRQGTPDVAGLCPNIPMNTGHEESQGIYFEAVATIFDGGVPESSISMSVQLKTDGTFSVYYLFEDDIIPGINSVEDVVREFLCPPATDSTTLEELLQQVQSYNRKKAGIRFVGTVKQGEIINALYMNFTGFHEVHTSETTMKHITPGVASRIKVEEFEDAYTTDAFWLLHDVWRTDERNYCQLKISMQLNGTYTVEYETVGSAPSPGAVDLELECLTAGENISHKTLQEELWAYGRVRM